MCAFVLLLLLHVFEYVAVCRSSNVFVYLRRYVFVCMVARVELLVRDCVCMMIVLCVYLVVCMGGVVCDVAGACV